MHIVMHADRPTYTRRRTGRQTHTKTDRQAHTHTDIIKHLLPVPSLDLMVAKSIRLGMTVV
jgi:hypothetical protein